LDDKGEVMTGTGDVVLVSGRASASGSRTTHWASEISTISEDSSQKRADSVLSATNRLIEDLAAVQGNNLVKDILLTLGPVRGQAGIFLPPEVLRHLSDAGISLYIDSIPGE
jgi:glycine/D-amino acid oxidase-like deaminating enzyme